MKNWDEVRRSCTERILAWAEDQTWARAMTECRQDAEWHAEGDVWIHTRMVVRELERLPEQDLDKLLGFLRSLKDSHVENTVPTLAAESALAKDWLTPEEDAAWASL